jgi:hypothetical protein
MYIMSRDPLLGPYFKQYRDADISSKRSCGGARSTRHIFSLILQPLPRHQNPDDILTVTSELKIYGQGHLRLPILRNAPWY